MRCILWLALRELWAWRLRSLLPLLALALSVGLLVATGSIGALMRASIATSAPFPQAQASEILWISSAYDADYDLPEGLAAQVQSAPGVDGVQPVLRRPVHVQTPRADALTLLGVEPAAYFAFHGLTLAAGALPTAESPGLVALAPWAFGRDLRPGDRLTVTTPSGDVALPLVGLVEVGSLAAARQGLVLYAPLDTVADLFGAHDAVTTLEVRPAPGVRPRQLRAELERALGPAYAISAATGPGQRAQLWERLVLGALIFVDGLTLAGSAGLVYAVFAAAARARRRQIGLLRAAGAVRRQVFALLATQAALLGLGGSAAGLLVGVLFARVGARQVFQGAGVPALPPLPPGTLALAVALGLLGALGGGLAPAMRAARQSPLAALRTAPHPVGRRSAPFQILGLIPGLIPGPRARRKQGRTGALPPELRLALANLARERRRATRVAAALALILAMALGNVGVLSLLGEELAATFGRLSGGDYLVLPAPTTISLRELAGQDTSDAPPLSPALLTALEELYLNDQVWLMRGTTADVAPLQVLPGQPTLLLDIGGYAQMGGFRFQAGDWPAALEAFGRGPAVLLTPVVARRLGVGLGDSVQIETHLGPVGFTAAGIGDSEFTTCVLDLAQGARYLGANEVNAVEVQVRPGADPDAVQGALVDAVHAHGGTLLPLDRALAQLRATFRQARASIGLLIGVTGLVAGLGVVNATLASVAERRRELAMLRAVGATRRQVARLILAEAGVLGTVAALPGTALGWAVTLAFLALARAHLGLAGGSVSSSAAWLPLVAASAAGLILWPLLAMMGGLGPALYAARLPVVRALEEG